MIAAQRVRALLPQQLQHHVHSAREMERRRREEEQGSLPSALPALDRLLAGGLPRGQLVELTGGRSSGRFSIGLQVLAAATGVGEAAALVDLGDGLDPADALALGIDTRRLLWLRPATLKQALAAAEMVIGTGFQLVVLDLGNPPLAYGNDAGAGMERRAAGRSGGGSKANEAAWLRLARAAKAQGAALLISSPYRVSGTAAGIVLRAGRGPSHWSQGGACLLGGISPWLSLDKGRGRRQGQQESLALRLPGSLPPPAEAPARQPARRAEPVPAARVEPPLQRQRFARG